MIMNELIGNAHGDQAVRCLPKQKSGSLQFFRRLLSPVVAALGKKDAVTWFDLLLYPRA